MPGFQAIPQEQSGQISVLILETMHPFWDDYEITCLACLTPGDGHEKNRGPLCNEFFLIKLTVIHS